MRNLHVCHGILFTSNISCIYVCAVAQRVSSKESWEVCNINVQFKVSLAVAQIDAMQEIGETSSQDNGILIEGIPDGVTEDYLRLYLESVTKLEEDAFTLEYKGTTASMMLQGDATG